MSLGFAVLRDTTGRKMSQHYEVRKNTFWILNSTIDLKGIGEHNNLSILIKIMVTMSQAPAPAAFFHCPSSFGIVSYT